MPLMLIEGVSFDRGYPWTLDDGTGPRDCWMHDEAFWVLIQTRRVSFRAGCLLDAEWHSRLERKDEDGRFLPVVQRVNRFWEPVRLMLGKVATQ